MKVIQPYVVTPWEDRLCATIELDKETAVETANLTNGIQIATSSSERRGIVGMGGVIYDTLGNMQNGEPITYSVTLRARTEQNPYTAELAAIAIAMRCLPLFLVERQITIYSPAASLHCSP